MAKHLENGNAAELSEILPTVKHAKQFRSLWSNPETLAADVIARGEGWHAETWGQGRSRKEFTGVDSMREAANLVRYGWAEGAQRAARLRDRINAANPHGPRMVRYDVAGAFPVVARAVSGNPLNMRRVDSAKLRRRPIVTLVSDLCCAHYIGANVLINRAAVVAAVVDAVEAAGFSCNVIGYARTERGDELSALCAVSLKQSDQAADIARLAFGLGHSAMLRRLMFAAWTQDKFTEKLGGGLGTVTTFKPTEALASQGIYIVPGPQECSEKFTSEEKAATLGLAHIVAALAKQGCPAFPQEAEGAAAA